MCVGPSPEMQLLMRLKEGYFVPLLTFYTTLMLLDRSPWLCQKCHPSKCFVDLIKKEHLTWKTLQCYVIILLMSV